MVRKMDDLRTATETQPSRKNGNVLVLEPQEQTQRASSDIGRLEEADFVTAQEDQDLKRGLSQRHIGLIAIAGAIVRLLAKPPAMTQPLT